MAFFLRASANGTASTWRTCMTYARSYSMPMRRYLNIYTRVWRSSLPAPTRAA
jgi:hypothetical protein